MRAGCLVFHCCLQLIWTLLDDAKRDSNCEHHPQMYQDQHRTHLQKKKKMKKKEGEGEKEKNSKQADKQANEQKPQ